MFNIMENNLLFTKKNDNDRIPIGVFCSEDTKGGSVYGKPVSAFTGM